jgi:hypothetical protein
LTACVIVRHSRSTPTPPVGWISLAERWGDSDRGTSADAGTVKTVRRIKIEGRSLR